jgi:hypothetical protein
VEADKRAHIFNGFQRGRPIRSSARRRILFADYGDGHVPPKPVRENTKTTKTTKKLTASRQAKSRTAKAAGCHSVRVFLGGTLWEKRNSR